MRSLLGNYCRFFIAPNGAWAHKNTSPHTLCSRALLDLYLHDTCTWLSSLPQTVAAQHRAQSTEHCAVHSPGTACTAPAYYLCCGRGRVVFGRRRDWGCFDRTQAKLETKQSPSSYGVSFEALAWLLLLLRYLITCAALLSQVRGRVRCALSWLFGAYQMWQ